MVDYLWILWYNVSIVQKEGSSVEANINSELTPEQEAELARSYC